jgi:hypothetical protein
MKPTKILLLAVLFSFAANGSFAQITIGSTPGAVEYWTGFHNWYDHSTETLAQVITTPGGVDLTLLNFSFKFMKGDAGDMAFTVAVAEWSGTRIADTVWTQVGLSAAMIYGDGGSTGTFLYRPNIALDGAKTYALLFLADVTSDLMVEDQVAVVDHYAENTLSGGLYRFFNNPHVDDFSGLAGPGWTSFAGTYDLVFSANFGPVSAVPEPSIPGLALGLGGLAGYAAWKRKRAAHSMAVPES